MISIDILCDDVATRDALARLSAPRSGTAACVWRSAEDFLDASESLDSRVLLIDLDTIGSAATLGLLRGIHGDPRFSAVVVTGSTDIRTAVEVMRAGAENLIEQPWDSDALAETLDAACARLAGAGAALVARKRIARLSPRERDVLDGMLAGLPNKSAARVLGISPRTIESYRASLMAKLGVGSLAEALRLALAAGVAPELEDIPESDQAPGQLAA